MFEPQKSATARSHRLQPPANYGTGLTVLPVQYNPLRPRLKQLYSMLAWLVSPSRSNNEEKPH